ncbi:hypothetical protein DFH07DRAFT_945077 [Mycena maculata]|uniref:Uncharacterized protein n=1 Tax=Mycena maculata TaxID=230809 RepID=A0AAD7MTE1_9AGAR|nr:hypothetical protein DFH07DRAFT_945077 [Mycena maculata]
MKPRVELVQHTASGPPTQLTAPLAGGTPHRRRRRLEEWRPAAAQSLPLSPSPQTNHGRAPERLLRPGLAVPLPGLFSTSMHTLGDHVNYSRPISGGWRVDVRMESYWTFASMSSDDNNAAS